MFSQRRSRSREARARWPPGSRVTRSRSGVCALLCLLTLGGAALPVAAEAPAIAPADEPIVPIPAALELDPAKVRLGERLFRDPRLAHGDHVACSSCHQLDRGGDDGQAHSLGADGRPLDFNTPTIFNAALSFRRNWRGNFRTLDEQAEAALLDPRLMATSWRSCSRSCAPVPPMRKPFKPAMANHRRGRRCSMRSPPSSVP